MQKTQRNHRPAAVAGMFYPASSEALREQLNCWLHPTPGPQAPAPPKFLLAPHAGYRYSGAMAARGYALLTPYRERIRRVVLLGPAHRVAVEGLAMPSAIAFATPLGPVPVDHEALAGLLDLPQVTVSDEAHAFEHSLEVQLPFLRQVLDRFTLAPLVVGRATPAMVAEVLGRLWGGAETLIVISSDLSHFLKYDQAQSQDRRTLQRILELDPGLTPDEAWGALPINGALKAAAAHRLRPQLLGACNSGDTTGDHDRVVGYAALAFWPPAPEDHPHALALQPRHDHRSRPGPVVVRPQYHRRAAEPAVAR